MTENELPYTSTLVSSEKPVLIRDVLVPDVPPTHEENVATMDKLMPAGRPEQFVIPPLGGTDEKADFDLAKQSQTWLVEGRFPAGIGNYIAEEVQRVSGEVAGLSERDRLEYRLQQRANFEKIYGSKSAQMIELANRLVSEIDAKHPGLADLLERTGAGDTATVIAQFAMHAERLDYRKGSK